MYISYQYLERETGRQGDRETGRQGDRFINESTKTNVTIPEARYLFSNHSVVSLGSRFLAHGFP